MDEEEMDEEEEHVEMDDRGRMKDLAPVSHWQGKREREKGTCYNFRQSTTAPPLISNITCLPLISTAHNFVPHYIHPSALAIVAWLKVQPTLDLPQYPAINARSCALHVLLKSNPTASTPGTGAVR